ncbi:putative transposase [Staphylococcus aureus]|nr:putative transposase [Staphylococcus aureus]SUK11275.1 putative transposase [Staphylococcus aureus]
MYKNYNMTQLTLPIETSVKIPQNDISRYVNEIVETIPDNECDDCSACSLRQQCMKPNSKSNKKIMKNYNWEYFKAQINQKLSEPETKKSIVKEKLM